MRSSCRSLSTAREFRRRFILSGDRNSVTRHLCRLVWQNVERTRDSRRSHDPAGRSGRPRNRPQAWRGRVGQPRDGQTRSAPISSSGSLSLRRVDSHERNVRHRAAHQLRRGSDLLPVAVRAAACPGYVSYVTGHSLVEPMAGTTRRGPSASARFSCLDFGACSSRSAQAQRHWDNCWPRIATRRILLGRRRHYTVRSADDWYCWTSLAPARFSPARHAAWRSAACWLHVGGGIRIVDAASALCSGQFSRSVPPRHRYGKVLCCLARTLQDLPYLSSSPACLPIARLHSSSDFAAPDVIFKSAQEPSWLASAWQSSRTSCQPSLIGCSTLSPSSHGSDEVSHEAHRLADTTPHFADSGIRDRKLYCCLPVPGLGRGPLSASSRCHRAGRTNVRHTAAVYVRAIRSRGLSQQV